MDETEKTTEKPAAQDWPNTVTTREELDSALEEGLKSGVSDLTIEQIFEETITRMKANGEL